MATILSVNELELDDFNPYSIGKGIAERLRERRLEHQWSQQLLAKKAGISLGSLKRFENNYEISLKHLLMLALVLDETEAFHQLFTRKYYQSIDEILKLTAPKKKRVRGRSNI